VLAQEMTFSPVAQNKGTTKVNINSLVKRFFMDLKKNKGKEKIPKLSEELVHMDLHSLKESKDVDSLLFILLNQPKREKGASMPWNI